MQKKIVYEKFYYINETKLTFFRRIKSKVKGRKVFVSLPFVCLKQGQSCRSGSVENQGQTVYRSQVIDKYGKRQTEKQEIY